MPKENVDDSEIKKFADDQVQWWDLEVPMRLLHKMNPLRLEYIESRIKLKAKQILDVGCGGGLLADPQRVGHPPPDPSVARDRLPRRLTGGRWPRRAPDFSPVDPGHRDGTRRDGHRRAADNGRGSGAAHRCRAIVGV